MFFLELLHMGAGDKQTLPIIHNGLVPLYRAEMFHVDNVGHMDMCKYPAVELLPYLADCHVCLEILWDCMDDCLASFLFDIKNVATAYPELVLAEMKNEIVLYHLEIVHCP